MCDMFCIESNFFEFTKNPQHWRIHVAFWEIRVTWLLQLCATRYVYTVCVTDEWKRLAVPATQERSAVSRTQRHQTRHAENGYWGKFTITGRAIYLIHLLARVIFQKCGKVWPSWEKKLWLSGVLYLLYSNRAKSKATVLWKDCVDFYQWYADRVKATSLSWLLIGAKAKIAFAFCWCEQILRFFSPVPSDWWLIMLFTVPEHCILRKCRN